MIPPPFTAGTSITSLPGSIDNTSESQPGPTWRTSAAAARPGAHVTVNTPVPAQAAADLADDVDFGASTAFNPVARITQVIHFA